MEREIPSELLPPGHSQVTLSYNLPPRRLPEDYWPLIVFARNCSLLPWKSLPAVLQQYKPEILSWGRQNLRFPPKRQKISTLRFCSDTRIVNRWSLAEIRLNSPDAEALKSKNFSFFCNQAFSTRLVPPDYLSSTRALTRKLTPLSGRNSPVQHNKLAHQQFQPPRIYYSVMALLKTSTTMLLLTLQNVARCTRPTPSHSTPEWQAKQTAFFTELGFHHNRFTLLSPARSILPCPDAHSWRVVKLSHLFHGTPLPEGLSNPRFFS